MEPPASIAWRSTWRTAANSRAARSNYGDLNGQLNALALGERRLSELLDAYGDAFLQVIREAA